jgi:hypothetical protein
VDLVAKKPNTSRGLGAKIARHKRYANHFRVLQGSKCKTVNFISYLRLDGQGERRRTGRLAGGIGGAPETLELG